MSEKLLPCPWCGGEPERINCSVHCNNADCEAQPFTAGQSQAEAAASWNRRTQTPPTAVLPVVAWQPIETMPKHGAILVFTLYRNIRIERTEHVKMLVEDAKSLGEECIFTHWMPLPDDAPTIAAASGGQQDRGEG